MIHDLTFIDGTPYRLVVQEVKLFYLRSVFTRLCPLFVLFTLFIHIKIGTKLKIFMFLCHLNIQVHCHLKYEILVYEYGI